MQNLRKEMLKYCASTPFGTESIDYQPNVTESISRRVAVIEAVNTRFGWQKEQLVTVEQQRLEAARENEQP